jgi:hypothetical protein
MSKYNIEGLKDVTKYANSTLLANKSRMKHVVKILDLYGVQPTKEQVLEYFKDKKISSRYMQSIVKILSKERGVALAINFKNIKRPPIPPADIAKLKNLLYKSLQFLADLKNSDTNSAKIFTRGKLESVVAIAIAYCTGLRTNEILHLRVVDLWFLYNAQVVPIRIKKREVFKIISTLSVYQIMYPYILFALAESYDTYEDGKDGARFGTDVTREEFLNNPQNSNLKLKKAFTTCTTTVNAEIRNAYLQYNNVPSLIPVGLKSIRKLNTTEIVELGAPDVASFFNRHSNIDTTENFYVMPDSAKAFGSLNIKLEPK